MLLPNEALTITSLTQQYAAGATTPREVVERLLTRVRQEAAEGVFISLASDDQAFSAAEALGKTPDAKRRLWGVPCVVKDNIDVAQFATTAACPAFAYRPARSATVVEKLVQAGAIILGKTNLDQFATGLVGTRSPYGVPDNPFQSAYISGGSSSGSAVAVARGYAAFALGTDTAGSGRVPAAFNNIVGLKPTRGMLSNRGVVPACAELDCVSVFALTIEDATTVADVMAGFDPEDPLSRQDARAWQASPPFVPAEFRLGVPQPDQLLFGLDDEARANFAEACAVAERAGARLITIDFTPLFDTARLLYEGPWVAQRLEAAGTLLLQHPEALHPVVRTILQGAQHHDVQQLFLAQRRLASLRTQAQASLAGVDALLVPTAPTIYTKAEVQADPIGTNQQLGRYTNFVNLLDLAALAAPAGFRHDGLPAGITLIGRAGSDSLLAAIGALLHPRLSRTLGTSTTSTPPSTASNPEVGQRGWTPLLVMGAHMRGLPLNHQLTERHGIYLREANTAPTYRLVRLLGEGSPRPGLVRVANGGAAIAAELWALPTNEMGSLLAQVPSPLTLGKVHLQDGSLMCGFLAEGITLSEAQDITCFGGWRAYVAAGVASTGG